MRVIILQEFLSRRYVIELSLTFLICLNFKLQIPTVTGANIITYARTCYVSTHLQPGVAFLYFLKISENLKDF